MRHDFFLRHLPLRIDVDFPVGLERAVPLFLDELKRAGMQATFFVVTGSNRTPLSRLLRPGYLRRLAGLGPRNILAALGPGALLGRRRFLEGPRNVEALRRIEAEGHELCVHGYDHAWWAEKVWSASDERIATEIERGYNALHEALGSNGRRRGWGSPNWRTTVEVLSQLERLGVPWFSDCWGTTPFRTGARGRDPLAPPHLPITLQSLERTLPERQGNPRAAVDAVLSGHRPGRYELACLHDYFEGLLHPGMFREFLAGCVRRGLRTRTLGATAHAMSDVLDRLPVHFLRRAPVPGFAGEVSWQG